MNATETNSNDLAEERTGWAEDRTIMANERTFTGWMRTGLAADGIGLGFDALFGELETDCSLHGIWQCVTRDWHVDH